MTAWVLALVALPLAAQDFSDVQVEKAANGFRFTEGPAWSETATCFSATSPATRS